MEFPETIPDLKETLRPSGGKFGKKMKRPSFQFYPADWKSNMKLRRCTEAARGAWVEILCLFHDSDEYGVIRWSLKDIALAAGVTLKSAKELVEKGVMKGSDKSAEAFVYIPRHAGQEGEPITLIAATEGPVWFCSRFVKDEHVRLKRGKNSRFSSTQQPTKAPSNHAPNPSPKPPIGDGEGDGPSSSSSSSSSIRVSKDTPVPSGTQKLLAEFWDSYPKAGRERSSKKLVADAWKALGEKPSREVVMDAIAKWKSSESWTKDNGQFVPGVHKWLKNRQWEYLPEPATNRTQNPKRELRGCDVGI